VKQLTPGLKSKAITTQNQQAYSLLEPSDWYVVRKSENGTAIPADWDTWRESIRTTYQEQVTQLTLVQQFLNYRLCIHLLAIRQ
jgi:hypothetical protein